MITQQDREDYGDDLIAFSRRAALEALGPEVRALQQQNQHLQNQLRQESRRGLEQQLDAQVPGWRRTYDDPAWRAWLDAPDDYSGRSRRELINHAAEAGDAARVAAFFRQPAAQHGRPRAYQSRANPRPADRASTPASKSQICTSSGARGRSATRPGPSGKLKSLRPLIRAVSQAPSIATATN